MKFSSNPKFFNKIKNSFKKTNESSAQKKSFLHTDFEFSDSKILNSDNLKFEAKKINLDFEKKSFEGASVGIFSSVNDDVKKIRLVLQSLGLFVKIFEDSQELIFAIQENLISILLIFPQTENDESFCLANQIRKRFSFFDFPILAISKKYNFWLVEKSSLYDINDFLVFPFDISFLALKIKNLLNCKNLYEQKEAALKSEKEKSAFLYFVTHNVNTPLTLLLNEIQSLENSKQNFNEASLKIIQENATEINSIIQNVLDSYKISDGRFLLKPQIFNLEEFLKIENKIISKKADLKNQHFSFESRVKDSNVFADQNSVKGIYTNLVDNAVKYTQMGGSIKVLLFSNAENIFLSICDNGQGISKEKRSLLFERFSSIGSKPTADEKSIGLGLYVVKCLCKMNDLNLEYEENSAEKKGSIFTVEFKKLGAQPYGRK